MRSRRKLGAILAAGASVAMLAGISDGKAGADSPTTAPDIWAQQYPIDQAANDVEKILAQNPEWDSYYAGMIADVEGGKLDVYLTAGAPSELTADVASALRPIKGSVLTAKYSQAELQAEAGRLIDQGLATGVSSESDGSGLVVESAFDWDPAENPYVLEVVPAQPTQPAVTVPLGN